MFRRLGKRLSHYDWTAICGAALVTVALVFFVRWVIPPHRSYDAAHPYAEQHSDEQPAQATSAESSDDRLANYTLWLTLFTGLLFVASVWQGALILRSEASTRAALKTSEKHAAYTRRAVRPVIIPSDPILVPERGGGITLNQIVKSEGGTLCGAAAFIHNRGNGLAVVLGASFRHNYGTTIGPMPTVATVTYMREIIGAQSYLDPERPICTVIVPKTVRESEFKKLFVCGWIRYMDIFGITRRAGYAWEFYPPEGDDIFSSEGGFVKCSEGDPNYWYEIEEPETDAE